MKKIIFEYLLEETNIDTPMTAYLNVKGLEGWELIQSQHLLDREIPSNLVTQSIFKRKIILHIP